MKRLKLLGLVLTAIFTLGSLATASALATERGFLLLEKEEGTVELKGVEGATTFTFEAEKKAYTCTGISLLKVILNEPGPAHFNLGKDGEIHLTGCKLGAIACSSVNAAGEKDPKEVILFFIDVHLVNLETTTGVLQPGIVFLYLGSDLKPLVKLNCGGVIVELRGAVIGLLTPLNPKKEITLTEEVTDIDVHFVKAGEKCDKTGEKVCQEIQEKEPYMINLGGGFVAATLETSLFLVTTSKMVLVDD